MSSKRQVVLLVEDNEERQAEIKEHLGRLNTVVLCARTHEEARAHYVERFGIIHLVILDDCVEGTRLKPDAEAFLDFLKDPGPEAMPYTGQVLVYSDDIEYRRVLRGEDLAAVTPKGHEALNAITRLLLVAPPDTDTFPIPD